MSLKNSSDTIRNRTRDLPVCSVVPSPTTPPRAPSTELCLTEITLSGSQIFFRCLFGVWQRNFEPVVCVHGALCTHKLHNVDFNLKVLYN